MPACQTGGNVLELSFSQYPQLQQVGGTAQVMAQSYSDPTCQQSNIIVIQKAQGQFVALSSSCTHACCQVTFNGTQLHCPCHGATFDLTGKPTSFIAFTPLQNLTVCADANGVYVTL